MQSVCSVQVLILAAGSNSFPNVCCHVTFDIRLYVDIFYPGLLLLRAWAFCGKTKSLARLFCFGLSCYLIAILWGYRSIIILHTKSNEESRAACAKALSNTRHTVGVGVTAFVSIHLV